MYQDKVTRVRTGKDICVPSKYNLRLRSGSSPIAARRLVAPRGVRWVG